MKIFYKDTGKPGGINSVQDTDTIKIATACFAYTTLQKFDYKFSSLYKADYMFYKAGSLSGGGSQFTLVSSTDGGGEDESLFPSLANANCMFTYSNIYSISTSFPCVTDGSYMFLYCDKLASVAGAELKEGAQKPEGSEDEVLELFPALKSATGMFEGCSSLNKFDSKLPDLDDGTNMFKGCLKLTYFVTADMNNLRHANSMFQGCSSLEFFTGTFGHGPEDDGSMDATCMFKDCAKLTSLGQADDECLSYNLSQATDFCSGTKALKNSGINPKNGKAAFPLMELQNPTSEESAGLDDYFSWVAFFYYLSGDAPEVTVDVSDKCISRFQKIDALSQDDKKWGVWHSGYGPLSMSIEYREAKGTVVKGNIKDKVYNGGSLSVI